MLQSNRTCVYVRVYVCVCMYVCVWKRCSPNGWILMKISTNTLTYICEVFILGFWHFEIDDVMAAILHFLFSGALARSQFCLDSLQKLPKKCQMTEYIDNALSDLVYNTTEVKL